MCVAQENELMKDKFLIVLDIQGYYTNGTLPEGSAQNLIDSANYIINNTNSNNVIYVKTIHRLLNLSFTLPYVYVSFDTAGMRFDKRLDLVNEYIFSNDYSGVFKIKELINFLEQNNAKEIVMIGLMAEDYIYESLIEGQELGYDMYMIPAAIHGESQKSEDRTITELAEKGIKILDMNMMNIE